MKILTMTDKKWKALEEFFPKEVRGRPQIWDNRKILEGVLYVLHTGCQWGAIYQINFPLIKQFIGDLESGRARGFWARSEIHF